MLCVGASTLPEDGNARNEGLGEMLRGLPGKTPKGGGIPSILGDPVIAEGGGAPRLGLWSCIDRGGDSGGGRHGDSVPEGGWNPGKTIGCDTGLGAKRGGGQKEFVISFGAMRGGGQKEFARIWVPIVIGPGPAGITPGSGAGPTGTIPGCIT